ncbi:MAG: hypothetical protein JWO36_6562 [Myxococcales bacterium]|nr:hypothetical protein [Myxococcales bacterium]
MSHPALRTDRSPKPLSSAYVDAVSTTFERALADAIRSLREPRVADVSRALKLLDGLVETLTGLAVGSVAGKLLDGARAWFGAEISRRIAIDLARTSFNARPTPSVIAVPVRYLPAGDDRVLVDELGTRLHLRLSRARAELHQIIALATAKIEALAPDRTHAIDVMIDLPRREAGLGERLADEIRAGWARYIAMLTGMSQPAAETARSAELWRQWVERASGKRPALTRSVPESAGYIMLVS